MYKYKTIKPRKKGFDKYGSTQAWLLRLEAPQKADLGKLEAI